MTFDDWYETYERDGVELLLFNTIDLEAAFNAGSQAAMEEEGEVMHGKKFDTGKLDWSVIPLEILEPLVEVFMAGERKYGYLNCLREFENGDRRFFAAAMRHAVDCQLEPLARDEETGCFHEAQAAWNHLMRLYHAKRKGIESD